jgi:hypothetical protein
MSVSHGRRVDCSLRWQGSMFLPVAADDVGIVGAVGICDTCTRYAMRCVQGHALLRC